MSLQVERAMGRRIRVLYTSSWMLACDYLDPKPKDHINIYIYIYTCIWILHPRSKAQDKWDSRNHGLRCLCLCGLFGPYPPRPPCVSFRTCGRSTPRVARESVEIAAATKLHDLSKLGSWSFGMQRGSKVPKHGACSTSVLGFVIVALR